MYRCEPGPGTGRGLVLIELLFVFVIGIILLGLLTTIYLTSLKSYTKETGRFDVVWEGQDALDHIFDEVREGLGVVSVTPNSLSCWSHDDNGNSVMDTSEVVSFYLSDHTLVRAQDADIRPLARNVSGFALEADDPVAPSLISFRLILEKNGSIVTLESKVSPR